MSAKVKEEHKLKNWFNRLQDKRTIVILDHENFEEKRSYITSKFSIYILFIFFSLIGFVLVFLIISSSSLKTLIPGYPNPTEQKSLMDKNIVLDQKLNALIKKTEKEEQYLSSVQQILSGEISFDESDTSSKTIKTVRNLKKDKISSSEKTMREKVENREKYDIDIIPGGALKNEVLPQLLLFPPIKGEITNQMNVSTGHFGVDVIAPRNEAVLSILPGTVIYENWSPTDGHIIQVQHKKNLLSIYKHNAEILKNIGEFVEAGEPIAVVGNSGDNSTGPHLHFELWHNGHPIDPEKFINFK